MKNGRKNPFRQQGKKMPPRQSPAQPLQVGERVDDSPVAEKSLPEPLLSGSFDTARPISGQPIVGQYADYDRTAVELLLQQARERHGAGRLAEAEVLYKQVLQHNPNHAIALHLLGMIACQMGNGAVGLELLDRAIEINPADGEAYCTRGNALYLLQRYAEAAESYSRAVRLKPDHAEAYQNRGVVQFALRQYQAAVESYDNALRLKSDFAEAYFNRGNAHHAMEQYLAAIEDYYWTLQLKPYHVEAINNRGCALQALQQYQAAAQCFEKALQLKPDYVDALNNRGNALVALEQHVRFHPGYEYIKAGDLFEAAVKAVARITQIQDKTQREAALDALPLELRSHPAVCNYRSLNFIKRESSGKDLVIYCSPMTEEWNPKTARTKGIGGSEEAVIWLSRLLHERGWNVTVYCRCGAEEEEFDGVQWKPDWMWNYRDRQDVTVIWRYPQLIKNEINTSQLMVDLHDVIPESEFTEERLKKIDRIFVKSIFHRMLLPHIPDEKFVIVPNGIDTRLFEGRVERDPLLLINTSSADRSLEAFVDCFEQIKRQVPNAKAQWAYGWGVWDVVHASDAQRMEWKAQIQRRMRELGVEELGRISHDQIAHLYRKANIFVYPTEFAEIDCISLSKAMAAGAIPVTTDFAAMGDKAGHGGVFIHSQKTKDEWVRPGQFLFGIADPEQRAQFVRQVVKLLLNPPSEQEREPMREWARGSFDWNKVADAWNVALDGCLAVAGRLDGIEEKGTRETGHKNSRGQMDKQQRSPRSRQPIGSQPVAMQPASTTEGILLQSASEHHAAGRFTEAEDLYRQILQHNPNHVIALHLLGMIACQRGDGAAALELLDQAIEINPADAEAYCTRGNALYLLQRYEEAAESYSKTIELNPDHAEAYSNRGVTLFHLRQYAVAVESYDNAIRLKPDFAEAHFNRGNSLEALEQYLAAIASYDRAIRLNPRHAEACNNRGSVLQTLQQHQAALDSYEMALSIKPDYADAHCNRGIALQVLKQYEAAVASYDMTIRLKPGFADALYNRGNVLYFLKQYKAALESYDKALLSRPDYEYLPGMRLHMKRFLCDWENIAEECQQVEAAINRNETAALPFAILAMTDSPTLQRRAAEIYVRDKTPQHPSLAEIPRRPKPDRIRIGYFSADYFNHATSYLMAELFERHDRSRFEIIGFSFGPDTVDEMSQRVSRSMDRFLDVRFLQDREVAELSRRLEVDIAVDLKGFTKDCRPGIFAERAAPIQVNYLGYPGTMAADYIDYLIADYILIPENSQHYYSEKIIYLPDSYQANDSQRTIANRTCTRAENGLPDTEFVFCCFNSVYKITPEIFDIWMRILGRVAGSVLWLLEENLWVGDHLRKEAARRGIAPNRLIFAQPLSLADHLARHRLADLFLDTLPYNAHTTASDALWTGLPVLTRTGVTFASRVAASLLHAMNLPDLVVATEAEYEEMAVALALDQQRYKALRQRVEESRQSAPLFNCERFTHHLESAYSAIFERYQAGLSPEHIYIR
jgi:predicted O-linked N-acetylglucosamine transferase (SPINDLY family)